VLWIFDHNHDCMGQTKLFIYNFVLQYFTEKYNILKKLGWLLGACHKLPFYHSLDEKELGLSANVSSGLYGFLEVGPTEPSLEPARLSPTTPLPVTDAVLIFLPLLSTRSPSMVSPLESPGPV